MSSVSESSFPVLRKCFDGADILVFFDIEGAQFSHKMISIGLAGYRRKDGIQLEEKPIFTYHSLVKCEDEIGPVVMNMTGITPEMVKKEGKDVRQVILDINRLIRPYKRKFISYGNQDTKMILSSIDRKDETEMNFFRNLMKNHLDFHDYLEKRVCDRNGQSYSIERLLSLFHLQGNGKSHDPLTDTMDLAKIYSEYIRDEEIIVDLYLEHYQKNPFQSSNNRKVISMLLEKKEVKIEDLRKILRENL